MVINLVNKRHQNIKLCSLIDIFMLYLDSIIHAQKFIFAVCTLAYHGFECFQPYSVFSNPCPKGGLPDNIWALM